MPRPCHAAHSLSPSTCTLCNHCVRDHPESQDYRRKWGESEPAGLTTSGPGRTVLLTSGIGDALALDSFTLPEVRESLTGMVLASPAARTVLQLYQAAPTYPNLRNFSVLPTGKNVYYSKEAVEKMQGPIAAEDWSIAVRFPTFRHYAGSSFLEHTLCRPRRFDRPYVIIVPHSSWGRWAGRSFTAEDWANLLNFLERRQLLGVVLHDGAEKVVASPRLVDLTGQTSILEAIELLKGAQGYLGIDSWASVLAAKLFPTQRIAVRSVWSHLYQNARVYYAPRTRFPFVSRTLKIPTWDGA